MLLALSAAAAPAYLRLREPILTWGATRAEATGALPGDELLHAPDDWIENLLGLDMHSVDRCCRSRLSERLARE